MNHFYCQKIDSYNGYCIDGISTMTGHIKRFTVRLNIINFIWIGSSHYKIPIIKIEKNRLFRNLCQAIDVKYKPLMLLKVKCLERTIFF